jgi:hypothetical protein
VFRRSLHCLASSSSEEGLLGSIRRSSPEPVQCSQPQAVPMGGLAASGASSGRVGEASRVTLLRSGMGWTRYLQRSQPGPFFAAMLAAALCAGITSILHPSKGRAGEPCGYPTCESCVSRR